MVPASPRQGPCGGTLEGNDFVVERLQRLELVHTVSRELHNSLELEALLPRVLSLVLDSIQAEAGSIWLLKGDKIVCEHAAGGAGDSIVGLELPRGAGVVGSVAETRRPEVVLDAATDKRHLQQVDEATGFTAHSMITVPLLLRGDCMGALQILNKKGGTGRFTKDDVEFLTEIALDAASVIRNSQLLTTESRAKEMKALLRMSREITSTLDLDRILTTAANVLTGIVAFDRCTLALERRGGLEVVALSGVEKVNRSDPEVKRLEELLAWMKGFEATVYGPDPEFYEEEDPPRAARLKAHAEASGMKSVLAVPLRDDSGFIGMLCMEAKKEDFLEEGQQEVVETFANQVAVALRNADLYRQTPLVGFLGKVGGGGGGLAAARSRMSAKTKRILSAAGVVLALSLIPFPRYATGEAEVLPAVRHHLRSDAALVVEAIDVEEGEEVAAGQVLGRLRTQELEVELAEVQARMRGYRADAMRHQAAGRIAEEKASLDLVRYSEAQEALTKARLDGCILRAPAAGFILTHRPRDLVGSPAEPGKTLLEVAEKGSWIAEVHVPQGEIGALSVGMGASFSTPSVPGVIFEGTVSSLGVTAVESAGTSAFPLTCPLHDPDNHLRSGMKGRGHIRTGTRSAARRVGGAVLGWLRWQIGI